MMPKPAELTILHYPAPILRNRANAVSKIDDHVRQIADRMIELMQQAEGVGLAAPQVGLPWRMFVTNIPDDGGPRVFINPKLSEFSKESDVYEEGCLSLPGVRADVSRPISVTLTAQDLDGNPVSMTSDGFAARVWQHEFDHLNGVLILDRLSAAERQAMRQSLRVKLALGG